MSDPISLLPPGNPKHSDEMAANQYGASIKLTPAEILHDTTFNEEEHLMCMAFNNPQKYIYYFNDYNTVPFWVANPPLVIGDNKGFQANYDFGYPNVTEENIFLASMGQASVNSSLSFKTDGTAGNRVSWWASTIGNFTGPWLWRTRSHGSTPYPNNTHREIILACGLTWSGDPNGNYSIGDIPNMARFTSEAGGNMHFRYGFPPNDLNIDTGIAGTGIAGNTVGAESSMHTFLAHVKLAQPGDLFPIVRIFADGSLIATASGEGLSLGTANDTGTLLECLQIAIGNPALMNIDYFFMGVERAWILQE